MRARARHGVGSRQNRRSLTLPRALVACGIALSTLTLSFGALGCLPYPHTTEKLPAMCGRIVDATTQRPIAGAVVAVHEHPSVHTTSDRGGRFAIAARHNFHLGVTVGMCSGNWPEGSDWEPVLDINCASYEPIQVDAAMQRSDAWSDEKIELQDIVLVPKR